ALRIRASARRPLLLAPFELKLQVVILEGLFRAKLTKRFARNPDRGPSVDILGNGEDMEGIAPRADWLQVFAAVVPFRPGDVRCRRRRLHPRRPPIEVLAVPERLPAGRLGRGGEADESGDNKKSFDDHDDRKPVRPAVSCQVFFEGRTFNFYFSLLTFYS